MIALSVVVHVSLAVSLAVAVAVSLAVSGLSLVRCVIHLRDGIVNHFPIASEKL